jgi:alkanesulfonate monooxygenase SsuD/methylene tetrahydromethanopterin reductase-like flavin-dependent oxidoreductase (luciferase family)
VRVAEELAMLDNISEGRVLAGFPRGIPVEYLAYDVDYDDSRARFAEALDLVLNTWTAEEPFDHHGEFWDFENVYAWPRPYQQPHPPLWMAAESDESLRFAAEHRMQVGTGLGSAEGIGERFAKYERFAEEAGWTPTEDDKSIVQMVYVAETDEAAREEAKEHLEFWNERLLGGVHLGATAIVMGDDRYHPEKRDVYMEHMNPHGERAFSFDFDEAVANGDVTVGAPETVTAELERKYEEMGGFGKLAAGFQFGTLPPALTEKNLRLYAEEVMPEVRKF